MNLKLFAGLMASGGAIILLYAPFLDNPIFFDDANFFLLSAQGSQPIDDFTFSPLNLRSLPYYTLTLTKILLGLNLNYFRIFNAFIHITTTYLIIVVTVTFYTAFSKIAPSIKTHLVAFIWSLFFALAPAATYAVGYLTQRSILMATMFCLGSIYATLIHLKTNNNKYLWISVGLYYFALLSKEHAIMLPAFIACMIYAYEGSIRNSLKNRRAPAIGFLVLFVYVLLARRGLIGQVYEPNTAELLGATDGLYPWSALTQSSLFFKYIATWLLPIDAWMSIDAKDKIVTNILSVTSLWPLLFIAIGLYALKNLKTGRNKLLGLGILYPMIMFATEFSTIRMVDIFVIYRSYLWMPLFGLLFIAPLQKLTAKQISCIILLPLLYIPVSLERLTTMSHPILLWEDAMKKSIDKTDAPGVYRIYYNLGTEYYKVDRYDDAIVALEKSISLTPGFSEGYGNLGAAYLKRGDFLAAKEKFEAAIYIDNTRAKPDSQKYHLGLARALMALKEDEAARPHYQISCRLAGVGCNFE